MKKKKIMFESDFIINGAAANSKKKEKKMRTRMYQLVHKNFYIISNEFINLVSFRKKNSKSK